MSEQKRVPFQSLGTTKKEKKGEDPSPSYRFSLTLPESNEQACPEFNYRELLKSAEKKRKKETKKGDENNPINGLDPHAEDDDDNLQEMAKRFEAKYGTTTTAAGRKNHNRYDDYVDLGAGYDESDSFIDNTDAYDEIVPEEWTTVRGGFYINSGPLEFKTSEGNTLIGNNNNNNNIEDESSESSEEEPEEPLGSPKQSKKRHLSSSEDDETEDAVSDHLPKKAKLDDNVEKNSSHDVAMKKKKKDLSILNRPKNAVVRDLLKVKREGREGEVPDDQQDDKKRSEKLDSVRPKAVLEKKFDIKKFEKKSSSNGLDLNKKSEVKKTGFYDDTIESVVNAARIDDQSSSDTMDSGKSRSLVCSNSECDETMDKEESPLPEAVTEDVKEILNKLKLHAENSKEGKTKFFNGPINSYLFSLEKKLRVRYSASVRLQTYAHLAHFLPCSKPTLVNRAKKLYLQDVDDKVKIPLERLKAAIDRIMPSVMVKYTRDCQRVTEDKGVEGSPTDIESSDGDDSGNKSSEKTKIPQRRFPWTEETKKLVSEIAAARREYFEILKPRKETVETFVSTFMDAKVRPLWPPGWVRLQTLLKYSNPQLQAKRKSKKHKEGSAASGISSSSGPLGSNILCTTTKSELNTANNTEVVNQERVKSPTNFTKTINAAENSANFTSSSSNQQTAKSSDINIPHSSHSDKKSGSKSKDKNRESPVSTSQYSASTTTSCSITNSAVAKISVVPTAQLMPPKSKSDKFNPMDLTSSSLSITPVNDYHKSSSKHGEGKEASKKDPLDTVSITPCAESLVDGSGIVGSANAVASQPQASSGYLSSLPQASSIPKPIPLKHRILQESLDVKQHDDKGAAAAGEKDSSDTHKTDRKEKKEKRSSESRHKSHESKKRKKEHHKAQEIADPLKVEAVPTIQSSLSKEEQEQRQIEETMAATNFLSQIINDDVPRPMTEKRKEASVLDETTGNMIIPPSEQEHDVQMVMRSLKELQELQEMTCSPSHSPVSVIQKPSKPSSTNMRYVSYQDEYQHLYHKKDDKLRSQKKEDAQW